MLLLNVMHLVSDASLWGPGRYIISLASKLNNNDCRIFLGYSAPGPLLNKAVLLGLETINIPMEHPFDINAAITLKKICKERSIDIIHTHYKRENDIAAISKLLGNKVILINTRHYMNEKNFFNNVSNLVFTTFNDTVIAVSKAVETKLRKEILVKSKIKTIYDGVDPASWRGRRGLKIRESLGIDRKAFVVTSAARFSEEKGHFFLLESIKRFIKLKNASSNSKQCIFLLAGDGELRNECAEMAKMLGIDSNIIFTGYLDNIKEILYTSDLFISHSKSEALGLGILEALACGLPVLATGSGGTSEIFGRTNPCGMLVRYGEPEEFASALLKFINDKEFYKTCKSNAHAAIGEKFDISRRSSEIYDLYIRSLTAGNF